MQKRAVVLEPEEKKVYTMIQAINTIRNEKESKRKSKVLQDREKYNSKKAKTQQMDELKSKERKRAFFKQVGLQEGMKQNR